MKTFLIALAAFAAGWSALAIWHGPAQDWLAYFFTRVKY